MGVKKYTVQIPGEEHVANWDEKEYGSKKEALFEKYPDAQVTELSLVNRDEIDPEGDYEIHVPGQEHVAQWKGTEFAMKGDALYTKYPKAQVYRKTDVSSQMRDEFVRNYEDTQDQLRTGNLTDRDRVEKNDYLDRYRYQYESILESRGTPRQYSIEKPNNNGHVVLDTKGYHQYIDGLGDGRRGMSADRALNEYIPSMDIAEVSKVDPNDVRATGQYQVKIPGERGMSTLSGEELLEIRDILLRDHPDMEVYRVSANINEQRDKDFVAQYEKAQDRASDEKLTEGERQQYADFVEKFSQRYDALKKQFGGELLMREYAGSLHRSKEAASRRPRILDYIIGNAGSNNAEPVYSTRQKLRYYSANGEFPQELKDAGLTAKDVEFHWGGGQSGAGYYTLSPSQAKQVDEHNKDIAKIKSAFSQYGTPFNADAPVEGAIPYEWQAAGLEAKDIKFVPNKDGHGGTYSLTTSQAAKVADNNKAVLDELYSEIEEVQKKVSTASETPFTARASAPGDIPEVWKAAGLNAKDIKFTKDEDSFGGVYELNADQIKQVSDYKIGIVGEQPEGKKKVTGFGESQKYHWARLGGGIVNTTAELLNKLNTHFNGEFTDIYLQREAYDELQRRIEKNEPLFRNDAGLTSAQKSTLDRKEFSAMRRSEKVDEFLNYLKDLAIADGKDPQKQVLEWLDPEKNGTGISWLKKTADDILEKNDVEFSGAAKYGGLVPMVAGMAGSIALAATGNTQAAAALGESTLGIFAASGAGETMKQARDAGATNEQVIASGLTSAAIMYAFSKIPMGKYWKQATTTAAAGTVNKSLTTNFIPEYERLLRDALKNGYLTEGNMKYLGQFVRGNMAEFGKSVASSTGSFAAMSAFSSLIPLIYENPDQYPILANMLNSALQGAEDGLILGTIGASTNSVMRGRAVAQRNKRWKEQETIYLAEIQSNGSDIHAVWNNKNKQWDPVLASDKPSEIRFAEVLSYNKKTNPNEFGKDLVEIMMDDGNIYLADPSVIKEMQRFDHYTAIRETEKAYRDSGYDAGEAAQTPEQKTDIRVDNEYQTRKAEKETAQGGVSEGTQLDVDRANAAMEGRRNAMRTQMEQRIGKPFWTGANGSETVDVLELKDDRIVFVLSEDEKGVVGVDKDGKPVMIDKDSDNIFQRYQESLNEYLDAQVFYEDQIAERERMATEQADNVMAIIEKVQQDGKVNLSAEENPVWGTVVNINPAADGGVTVQVDGEANPRFLNWKQVASTLNMPFEPKSNEDLVADRLKVDEEVDNYNNNIPVDSDLMVQLEGGDVVAYKFKDAEQVDGDIILHAEDTETGEVVDIFPEMVTNLDALVKGEVAVPDVDGDPVPVSMSEPVEPAAPVFSDPVANELGIDAKFAHTTPSGEVVVDGRMLWNENPELWAEWNDRNPDRGIPTREYLEDKQQKATQEALDALEAYKAEWKGNQDPDVLQTLKAEMDKKTDRKQRIDNLVKKYDEAEKAAELERNQPAPVEEVKPAEPAAPAPVVAENPTPEVTPIQREALETIGTTPERAAMDVAQAKLDDIARRNTPDLPRSRKVELMREKAGVLQEMIDREGSKNTIVSTREDILGQYKKDGGSQGNLEKLEDALNHSVVTNRVRGFSDNGKAYIIADDIVSAEDAHLANKHEEKHIENNRTGAHIEALKTGVSRQQMEDALFNLTRTNFYNGKDAETLADEILANAAEIAEKDGVDAIPEKLGNAGISNAEFINFVQNNIEHGRRISGRDVAVRNPEGVRNASEVGGRQDGTNPSAGSGAVEGRLRAPERGGEADRAGEEVTSIREQVREESNTPDENGVTPAQTSEITAAVGGEMEKGPATKFSVTAIAEGAGLEAIGSDSEGNVVFVGPDGKRFTGKDTITADYLKNLPNAVIGYMMEDAKRIGTVNGETEGILWKKYADMLNAFLQKGLAENGGINNLASQWQWIAETVYKTVASNSDAQYSYSLDITRVCKKNEAVIKTIAEVQRRLGRGVTPAEIMEIYLASEREGYQVPCPVCYVFSRYIRNGQYATIMINGQRKYGSRLKDPRTLTAEEKEAEINYWKEELAKQQKNNARNKKAITKAKADIQSTLDEIDKLGRRLLLGIDTGEKAEDTMMKIYALDERYRAALQVVSQAGLDGWITNFAIHEVNGKTELYDDSYQGFPEEMALDLRETATVLREYPAIQRYRNSRGAAAGKEITFEANNDLGEVPMMLGVSDLKNAPNYYKLAVEATDPVVREEMLKKARERFTKAHLYAQRQSLRGGQRQWSWSDNIERLSPDVFVNLMQMEMLGGALQSYSKQLEGINLVARMGGYVNGSLMGKGIGYREVDPSEVVRDGDNLFLKDGDLIISDGVAIMTPVYEKDGKYYTLEFDDVVGVDAYGKDENGHHYKGLFELNHNLDKAGNILVGMDDLHIRVAMADDRVFFIIPWHSSGGSVHILKQMLRYLNVDLKNFKPTDYTNVQEEKAAMNSKGKINPRLVEFWEAHKNETDFPVGIAGGIPSGEGGELSWQQKHYKELRDAIFVGIKEKTGKLNKDGKPVYKNVPVEKNPEWMREIMRDEFLSQAYAKVRGTVDDGAMTSTDTKYIYPYEYWDESSVYNGVDKNSEEYKKLTERLGREPYPAEINGARYLEYCRRLGYKPKFVGKLDGKPASDFGNFADDKGYWKLLIDRRMYDTRGYFQDLTPVSSEGFSTDLVDPEKTAQEFKVTRVADDAAAKVVADRMLDRESARPSGVATVNYDSNLDEAVKNYNAVLNKKPSAPTAEQREGLRRFLGNLEEDFGDTQAESSDSGLRLSVVNSNQEIFVSNAEKAVSDIKMEKATPEQWLKMIEKGGGLKAGEDKWIGLSDWLKSSDRKSLTKQEVSDFIEQNRIRIEEVHYSESVEKDYADAIDSYREEYAELVADGERNGEKNPYVYAYREMAERYGDDFEMAFERDGESITPSYDYYGEEPSDAAKYFLDQRMTGEHDSPINTTRLNYTTEGLENKREIALTVPTIEPWNESDKIHFGDAGEGRAISWIRFGDVNIADVEYGKDASAVQEELRLKSDRYLSELMKKYHASRINDLYRVASKEELKELDRLQNDYNKASRANAPAISNEKKVLFIDEIQSKRHQDAREKGYADESPEDYSRRMNEKYGTEFFGWQDKATPEEFEKYRNLSNGIPAAPFEKNWHELAMKRMLRLAAEEGYDYVAWTTGDQQADRYNLGVMISKIEVKKSPAANDLYQVTSYDLRGNKMTTGSGMFLDNQLGETFGKDLAVKMIASAEEASGETATIDGDNLRVGGEGMRGFYDDILPRFMNKYGKKWGVKVEDLDIPDIGKTGNGLTMHAVPVTPEMKESVMGGQPMFSVTGDASLTDEQRNRANNVIDYLFNGAESIAPAEQPKYSVRKAETPFGQVSKLDSKQRERTLAESTEDVPRNEQIVTRKQTIQSFEENGLGGVIGEENVEPLMRSVYAAIPKSVKAPIVDKAVDGLDFRKPLNEYLHELAAKGTENDETGLLFAMYDEIRALTGNPDLTDNDIRYMIWKSSGESNGDILSMAEDIAVRNRWNVGKDEPKFSVRKQDLTEAVENAQENLDEKMANAEEDLKEAKDAAPHLMDVLNPIIHSMSAQKEYDRATVDGIVDFAKQIIKNGGMTGLNTRDFNRMLTVIKSSVGKSPKSVEKYSNELLDKLLDHMVKDELAKFDKLVNIKDVKTNQSGVATVGSLDVSGQISMRAMRDYMLRPQEEIDTRIAEVENKFDSEDKKTREDARAEYEGLKLASDYQRDLAENIKEGNDLENELDEAKDAKRSGDFPAKEYAEFAKVTEQAIRENKIARVDFYRDFINRLAELQKGSKIRAHAFREAEKDRVERIHHLANLDMQGTPNKEHLEPGWKSRALNSTGIRFFLKPLATFDQMLRLFGRSTVTGEGYLYNHFGRGWIDAREKELVGKEDAMSELDQKVQEVFDDPKMKWAKLYDKERKMPGATVYFFDGGEKIAHDLTPGNLLYIYMANKMIDGKMKLRKMGISEDDVTKIKESLEPKFVELADWLQEEFLPKRRAKYNAIHEEMFGAPMAAIDDYFPLKILSNARVENIDLADDPNASGLSSTTTGSIVKRQKNSLALDLLNTDAFSLAVEHIEEMENWAAFAKLRRDMNTLLSYKRFRNQVQNMDTVYGSGRVLWDNFRDVASIAMGNYKPKVGKQDIDTLALNVAKGVTGAKIAFRIGTALKQVLSAPAFLSDARIDILAKNLATAPLAWNWCAENLPVFRERWNSRFAGDTRLMKTESDWKLWKNKLVQKAGMLGMSPNAFVDALTVAVGAKSMYETNYKRYVDGGYSEEEADRKAKQDATILYNQTQQSSEAMFTSAMQLDRTLGSVLFTVFRNSSMGYTRQTHDAFRIYGRMSRDGYKERAIERMTRQRMEDGLNEDQARAFAKKEYNRQYWRSATRIGIFAFLLPLAWNYGVADLLYLAFGDDDKEKEKIHNDALGHTLAGPIEGLTAGSVLSSGWGTWWSTRKTGDIGLAELPIESDLDKILSMRDYDAPAAVAEIINLFVQSGIGVNPQTFTDAMVATIDAFEGDMDAAKEFAIWLMRVNQLPQPSIERFLIDEVGMAPEEAKAARLEDLAKRYADYKLRKGAPLNMWMYDEGLYEKRHKSYETKFKKKVTEREKLHDEQETN